MKTIQERIKAFVTWNGGSFRSAPTRGDKGPFFKVTGQDKYLNIGEGDLMCAG